MLPNRSNMFAKLHDRDTARRAGALRAPNSRLPRLAALAKQ